MMIMPNEEKEWVYQVVYYIHSPALFTQRGNDDFDGEIKREHILKVNPNLICRSGRSVC